MDVVDPWIFATIGLAVVSLFLAGLAVPRRPRMVRAPVTDAKLDAIYRRLDAVEKRQQDNDHDTRNIRTSMKAMATQRDMTELKVQVATVAGSVNGMSGKVEAVQDTLKTNSATLILIQQYLYAAGAESLHNKNSE
ncbi:hypothetical protein ACSD7O_22290 [Methylorubrum extorquens]|uniref:hypothetical protein n=1 Tax=Methylorubrum extorquens TaxID=408 RepID=UPI003F622204